MSPLETQILQQIAQLQSTMGGNNLKLAETSPQVTSAPVIQQIPEQTALTEADVIRIARQVLIEELAFLKDSTTPTKEEQVPEVSPLVQAINEGLTEDERTWLFQPERMARIEEQLPNFLLTEDGKLAIQSFVIYFRGLYED